MSRDDHEEILREITSEEELAGQRAGDWLDGARKAHYEISQFVQCTGLMDCGGCDPNGPYAPQKPSGTSGGGGAGFHC